MGSGARPESYRGRAWRTSGTGPTPVAPSATSTSSARGRARSPSRRATGRDKVKRTATCSPSSWRRR
eukprot:2076948-Heterocapsa_arctica.AAC.1